MPEIKTCPYCGSDNCKLDEGIGYVKVYVICENCETFGPSEYNERNAIRKWNAAAEKLEAKDAEIEKLESSIINLHNEIEKLTFERDFWHKVWEYDYRYWQRECKKLSDKFSTVSELMLQAEQQRDEARKIARQWFDAAAMWQQEYEQKWNE